MKTIPHILPQLISDMERHTKELHPELFRVEEVLSPRLQWAKDYAVRSCHSPHMSAEEMPWCAWMPDNDDEKYHVPVDGDQCGYGVSEIDAHEDLAAMYGFVNWKKLEK